MKHRRDAGTLDWETGQADLKKPRAVPKRREGRPILTAPLNAALVALLRSAEDRGRTVPEMEGPLALGARSIRTRLEALEDEGHVARAPGERGGSTVWVMP